MTRRSVRWLVVAGLVAEVLYWCLRYVLFRLSDGVSGDFHAPTAYVVIESLRQTLWFLFAPIWVLVGSMAMAGADSKGRRRLAGVMMGVVVLGAALSTGIDIYRFYNPAHPSDFSAHAPYGTVFHAERAALNGFGDLGGFLQWAFLGSGLTLLAVAPAERRFSIGCLAFGVAVIFAGRAATCVIKCM